MELEMVEFKVEKVRGLLAERGKKLSDLKDYLGLSYAGLRKKMELIAPFNAKEIKMMAQFFNVIFFLQ